MPDEPTDEELAAAGRSREEYQRLVDKLHRGNRAEALKTLRAIIEVRSRPR